MDGDFEDEGSDCPSLEDSPRRFGFPASSSHSQQSNHIGDGSIQSTDSGEHVQHSPRNTNTLLVSDAGPETSAAATNLQGDSDQQIPEFEFPNHLSTENCYEVLVVLFLWEEGLGNIPNPPIGTEKVFAEVNRQRIIRERMMSMVDEASGQTILHLIVQDTMSLPKFLQSLVRKASGLKRPPPDASTAPLFSEGAKYLLHVFIGKLVRWFPNFTKGSTRTIEAQVAAWTGIAEVLLRDCGADVNSVAPPGSEKYAHLTPLLFFLSYLDNSPRWADTVLADATTDYDTVLQFTIRIVKWMLDNGASVGLEVLRVNREDGSASTWTVLDYAMPFGPERPNVVGSLSPRLTNPEVVSYKKDEKKKLFQLLLTHGIDTGTISLEQAYILGSQLLAGFKGIIMGLDYDGTTSGDLDDKTFEDISHDYSWLLQVIKKLLDCLGSRLFGCEDTSGSGDQDSWMNSWRMEAVVIDRHLDLWWNSAINRSVHYYQSHDYSELSSMVFMHRNIAIRSLAVPHGHTGTASPGHSSPGLRGTEELRSGPEPSTTAHRLQNDMDIDAAGIVMTSIPMFLNSPISLIQTVLNMGADPHAQDHEGRTVLHCVASTESGWGVSSDTAIAAALLEATDPLKAIDQQYGGFTPLQFAAVYGKYSSPILKLCLTHETRRCLLMPAPLHQTKCPHSLFRNDMDLNHSLLAVHNNTEALLDSPEAYFEHQSDIQEEVSLHAGLDAIRGVWAIAGPSPTVQFERVKAPASYGLYKSSSSNDGETIVIACSSQFCKSATDIGPALDRTPHNIDIESLTRSLRGLLVGVLSACYRMQESSFCCDRISIIVKGRQGDSGVVEMRSIATKAITNLLDALDAQVRDPTLPIQRWWDAGQAVLHASGFGGLFGKFDDSIPAVSPHSSTSFPAVLPDSSAGKGTGTAATSVRYRPAGDDDGRERSFARLMRLTSLAVQILCVGVHLYANSHTSFEFSGREDEFENVHSVLLCDSWGVLRSSQDLKRGVMRPRILVSPQELTCVGKMIGGPVWVFELFKGRTSMYTGLSPKSMGGTSNVYQEEQSLPMEPFNRYYPIVRFNRYYLLATAADMIDAWGAGSFVFWQPPTKINDDHSHVNEPCVQINICGGKIQAVPTEFRGRNDSRAKGPNVLCHWVPLHQSFDWGLSSRLIIPLRKKLLIGMVTGNTVYQGLLPNPNCSTSSQLRSFNAFQGSMLSTSALGTMPSAWEMDGMQLGLTGGQFVNLGVLGVWKRMPSRTLKMIMLELWNQGSLRFLLGNWGLEVSPCTGNARRVPLYTIIQDPAIVAYVDTCLEEEWGGYRATIVQALRFNHMRFESFCLSLNGDQRKWTLQALGKALHILSKTGVSKNGKGLVTWLPDDDQWEPTGINLTVEHSPWIGMMRESESCAVFAAVTSTCLEPDIPAPDKQQAPGFLSICNNVGQGSTGSQYRNKHQRTILLCRVYLSPPPQQKRETYQYGRDGKLIVWLGSGTTLLFGKWHSGILPSTSAFMRKRIRSCRMASERPSIADKGYNASTCLIGIWDEQNI